MKDELKQLIETALHDTGVDLKHGGHELTALIAQRAAELSILVGVAGYEQACIAARDELALAAGLEAVDQADKATARVLSIIQGGLLLLAGAV